MSEESIRALPIWRGEIQIEPLSGGLTNLNYLVLDGESAFAVREGTDDPALGISRSNELACTRAAAEFGFAPRIAHAEEGILVSDFITNSTPLTPELLSDQEALERTAKAIRAIHAAGPGITGHLMYFSPFQVTRTYVRFAADNDLALPRPADDLLQFIRQLQGSVSPSEPTFCHNDMMPGNFLDTGDRLWIIDWEYSGVGAYPLFDLAGLSSNCGFDAEQDEMLLGTYSGDDETFVTGRAFQIMKAMAALRESLWAVIQGSQTKIEFDYDGYRDENFEKFSAFRAVAMRHP